MPSLSYPNAHAAYFYSRTMWTTQWRTWEGLGGRQACIFGVGTTVATAVDAAICSIEREDLPRLNGFVAARHEKVRREMSLEKCLGELFLDVPGGRSRRATATRV